MKVAIVITHSNNLINHVISVWIVLSVLIVEAVLDQTSQSDLLLSCLSVK